MSNDKLPFQHPWDEGLIKDYASVIVGGTPRTEIEEFWGGDIPWMASGEVHLRHIYDVPGRITERGLRGSNAVIVQPKAVAIALAGQGKTRGTVALTHVPICTNQSVALIKPIEEKLDAEFLYQSLIPRYEELRSRSAGGGRAGLSKGILEQMPIQVPPLSVQQQITKVLSTIDRTITHTEALIEKYQQIKAGLMHDLFTRGIGADGKLRPPRDRAPELYKDSLIGWIPKEWGCSPLRTKSQQGVPHLKTGPFGSSLKGKHWVEDGVPVITIGALGEGKFNIPELLFINDFDAKRLNDFQMKFGDVVFSRVADVGRSVVIDVEQIGWIMSSNLMRISLDRNLVNPNFLQYQLSYDFRLKNQIRCKVNSGGRDVANSEVLNSLFFVWPRIGEQLEITKRAESISSRINAEDIELQKLHAEKSGLMHDLLTGTVQVNSEETTP
jgi:type I restriction enzyme, S subunit